MTQSNPDQQGPERRDRLASAIRLLAHAVIFFTGGVMFGLGGAAPDHSGSVSLAMGVGALVMLASGIMFFLALWD